MTDPIDLQDFIVARLQKAGATPPNSAEILESRLENTGLDSLDFMQLIVAIEKTYGVAVDDSRLRSNMTVAEFIAEVRKCPAAPTHP